MQPGHLREPGRYDPHNIEIVFSLGNALSRLGRFDEAIRIFDIALGIEPSNGQILLKKGIALASINRHNDAEIVLQMQPLRLPDQYEPHYLRGLSLVRLGRHAEAVAEFDAALALCDNNRISGSRKAVLSCNWKNMSRPSLHSIMILANNPEHIDAFLERGRAFFRLGNYAEAVESFDQVIRLSEAPAVHGMRKEWHYSSSRIIRTVSMSSKSA